VNTQKDLQSNRTEIIELTRADLEPVFEVFVQQLRLLIGVEQVWPVNQLSSAAQKVNSFLPYLYMVFFSPNYRHMICLSNSIAAEKDLLNGRWTNFYDGERLN
jgi:hypothetical protein